jgi:hypothetical protein
LSPVLWRYVHSTSLLSASLLPVLLPLWLSSNQLLIFFAFATILSLSVLHSSLTDFFEGSTDAGSTTVCAAAHLLMICT